VALISVNAVNITAPAMIANLVPLIFTLLVFSVPPHLAARSLC
jgi:hypothetical protein